MNQCVISGFLTILVFVRNGHSDDKIVGGVEIRIEDVPYQVSVNGVCGGSLIKPQWILTAAHCLTSYSSVRVSLGSDFFYGGSGTQLRSNELIIHEDYNTTVEGNDIALIKLPEVVRLSRTIKVVDLPKAEEEVDANKEVLVSGWGDQHIKYRSRKLRAVKLRTYSNDDCNYYMNNLVKEGMFCAGVRHGGKDSCQGDSGGPLIDVATRTQIGIVSWGYGCAKPYLPGVYTDVSHFAKWIEDKTKA